MMNIRRIFRLSNLTRNPTTKFLRPFSTSDVKRADVDVKIENGIRTITMNRPSKLNALTTEMYRNMANSMNESNTDDSTKIVVITGSGPKSFTSGYDLACLIEDYKNKVQPNDNGASAFIRSLIDSRKPIVALVNGNAVGIGVTMLALCETVYMTEKAKLNTPFIRLAIPPECGSSYLFPKIVGHVKAGELLHFNETWTAQDAYINGLVTKVFPDDQFEAEAWERVRKMAEHPLKSLVHSKELLRGRERDLLHRVHQDENNYFDLDVIGPSAVKLMSDRKK